VEVPVVMLVPAARVLIAIVTSTTASPETRVQVAEEDLAPLVSILMVVAAVVEWGCGVKDQMAQVGVEVAIKLVVVVVRVADVAEQAGQILPPQLVLETMVVKASTPVILLPPV
jgi:hypothetical protein